MEEVSKVKQWAKTNIDDSVNKLREQYDNQNHLLKELISDVTHWKRKEEKIYEEID